MSDSASSSQVPSLAPSPSLPVVMRLGLALAAGLLLTAGYALHPLWWAPWLAPVLLIPAGRGSALHATWTGAVAGALAMASLVTYYAGLMPWPVVAMFFVLRMVSWMGMARAVHSIGARLPLPLAVLILPAMAAGLEWLTLSLSPHGAAGSLAYSQMDVPGVVQVAALGGVPAVVFVMLLPGSLAGLLLSRARPLPETAVAVGMVAAIAAGVTVYSTARLTTPAPARTVPAVMVASNRFPGIPEDWAAVWNLYQPTVAARAPAGGILVLPEKIALLDRATADLAARDLSAVAVARHSTIVAGLEVKDTVFRNRAIIARPDGSLTWYDKQRMVPGLEARDVPGTTPVFFKVGDVPQGVAICKDMHIPSIGREYAGRAAVMAVPAWDFGQDGWMAARMTALRAVEGGYAIARSSRNGMVGAYDSRGRVIAEQVSGDAVTVVTADVPATTGSTLYSRIGDVFGMICAALTVGLIVLGRIRIMRGKSS